MERARDYVLLDYWAFIPFYVTVLLLGMISGSAHFERGGRRRLGAIGMFLGGAVVVAGLFDAVENLFLLCMIDARMNG